MAEGVRAEQRRSSAAAPANLGRARIEAGLRLKEKKRRAWFQSRLIFEAAFGRQFAPDRFTYEFKRERGGTEVCHVAINYEGKLDAHVEVWPGDRPHSLAVRPLGSAGRAVNLQAGPSYRHSLSRRLAEHVAEWGLA